MTFTGNLLAMQVLEPHPRPTEAQNSRYRAQGSYHKPPGWFGCTCKSEKHSEHLPQVREGCRSQVVQPPDALGLSMCRMMGILSPVKTLQESHFSVLPV